MSDEQTYEDVLKNADPYNEDRPMNPLEVYVMERKQRRSRSFRCNEPMFAHLFIVLDHERERIAYEGRWTTPDSHHNTYDSAKGRAFGFISGYGYARSEHKRIEGDFDKEIANAKNEPAEWIWQTGE